MAVLPRASTNKTGSKESGSGAIRHILSGATHLGRFLFQYIQVIEKQEFHQRLFSRAFGLAVSTSIAVCQRARRRLHPSKLAFQCWGRTLDPAKEGAIRLHAGDLFFLTSPGVSEQTSPNLILHSLPYLWGDERVRSQISLDFLTRGGLYDATSRGPPSLEALSSKAPFWVCRCFLTF